MYFLFFSSVSFFLFRDHLSCARVKERESGGNEREREKVVWNLVISLVIYCGLPWAWEPESDYAP